MLTKLEIKQKRVSLLIPPSMFCLLVTNPWWKTKVADIVLAAVCTSKCRASLAHYRFFLEFSRVGRHACGGQNVFVF